jgi:hypothetical protein
MVLTDIRRETYINDFFRQRELHDYIEGSARKKQPTKKSRQLRKISQRLRHRMQMELYLEESIRRWAISTSLVNYLNGTSTERSYSHAEKKSKIVWTFRLNSLSSIFEVSCSVEENKWTSGKWEINGYVIKTIVIFSNTRKLSIHLRIHSPKFW